MKSVLYARRWRSEGPEKRIWRAVREERRLRRLGLVEIGAELPWPFDPFSLTTRFLSFDLHINLGLRLIWGQALVGPQSLWARFLGLFLKLPPGLHPARLTFFFDSLKFLIILD